MSKFTIQNKIEEIRNQTVQYGNTRKNVADLFTELNNEKLDEAGFEQKMAEIMEKAPEFYEWLATGDATILQQGWRMTTVDEIHNGKIIRKVTGYEGGTGTVPTAHVGEYFSDGGFTSVKDDAINFKGADGSGVKIPTWAAQTYTSGSQVVKDGKIYEANAATVAGDVPGVSSKWVAIGGGVNVVNKELKPNYDYVSFAISNTYISSTGITTSAPDWRSSALIDVNSGESYVYFGRTNQGSGSAYTVAGYNSAGAFVQMLLGNNQNGVNGITFTIPAGINKIRISSYQDVVMKLIKGGNKLILESNLYDYPKIYSHYIPFGAGSFKIGYSEDSLGNEVETGGWIKYTLFHKKLTNATLRILLSTSSTASYINIHNADGTLLESKNYPTGWNNIDLTTVNGEYIVFSLNASLTPDFELSYSQKLGKREPIYNLHDYMNANGKKMKLDHSECFQNLMDFVSLNGGGTIYVPAGTYNFFTPINCKSTVNIIGDGENLTIFKPRGELSAFIGNNISNVNYRDFQIDGEFQKVGTNGYTSSVKGIFQTFLTNVTYKNLLIKNTGATGLGCDHFISGLIENVRAENCGRLVDLTQSKAPGASGIGIGTGSFARGNESLTIINCYIKNCGQNGIFIERQYSTGDHPVGTSVIGCTSEGSRIGFGCSGNDNLLFIGCTAYNNHHAGFSYDKGTMDRVDSFGKFVKYIGCIAKKNGRNIPVGYPNYSGDLNGFGWYIKGNYNGIELTNCDSTENLKSGLHVKSGITNLYINGGRFAENLEHGIDLNGVISKFKISPSILERNTGDGLRINGNMTNGFIKDLISTANTNGINKVTGTFTNVLVKDNLAFSNTSSQFINITST